jgi:hypothetical protein
LNLVVFGSKMSTNFKHVKFFLGINMAGGAIWRFSIPVVQEFLAAHCDS